MVFSIEQQGLRLICAEALLALSAVISGPILGAAGDIWEPPEGFSRRLARSFAEPVPTPLMNRR
ncbi:hypothetical protein [Aminobacter sp. HY435]|uniref:hypothetical protein n=1 Tax=Aminobacter sp. HY435 TaxID=2970917 RepID=UPI0022B98532|nr:hypothetical protein [Aminobacter sp. HY435]